MTETVGFILFYSAKCADVKKKKAILLLSDFM